MMRKSQQFFQRAEQWIPGGVNSPVRAFNGVGGVPLFIKSAYGSRIVDVDNKEYIDFVGSWGPMIAGHAHPAVIAAVNNCISNGLSFGAPTELEVQLAQQICQLMPAIEKIRLVNSGTEATMSAIRLARGYTQRNKIIKFAGCYHGHSDSLLVSAGSGALTAGVPSSAGVLPCIAANTLVAEYNNLAMVEALFQQHGNDIAAVIVEPVAGNMNCVPPVPGFLAGLRALCSDYQAILIFDEVMTGFRVALGGAQARYGVKPDLTTLGKVIGGGLPVGAFGGKIDIMDYIAPLGPVYQAGTLSGNPIATTAGLATLAIVTQPDFYSRLEAFTTALTTGLAAKAEAAGVAFHTTMVGGMFGLFFTKQPAIRTYADVEKSDLAHFRTFFHAMLKEGVYFAPSAYEAGFTSAAHTREDLSQVLSAAEKAFHAISQNV